MTDDATTIFQGRNGSEGQSWISRPPKEPASISMLNLARANLKVKLYSIAETSLSEHQKQIYATVKEMLNAPTEVSAITEDRGWDGIYQAESSIALLYNGERLRQEVDACLQDLTNLNKAEAHTLRLDYQRLVKHAVDGSTLGANDTTLSVYLLRLMEGVHWNKKKMYVVHELYAQATRRILWCILASFVLLILPYIAVNVTYDPNKPQSWMWSMLILWTALTAGLFGAFFFRLTDLKNRSIAMGVDEVALQRRWSYTLLRAGVGVCGALVVYFFLRSGIVEGALVPKFEEIKIEPVEVSGGTKLWMAFMVPSKAMALFTIWCFLAGYSEKLVPGILSGAEEKLTGTASPVSRV